MRRYVTRQDAIDQAIAPALTEGSYDLEAICQETYTWMIDTDADGNELLTTGGFEQSVSDDEFWMVVERHGLDGLAIQPAVDGGPSRALRYKQSKAERNVLDENEVECEVYCDLCGADMGLTWGCDGTCR
jgi:hypothetical protein